LLLELSVTALEYRKGSPLEPKSRLLARLPIAGFPSRGVSAGADHTVGNQFDYSTIFTAFGPRIASGEGK
jgi:hypothetical protein